MGGVLQALDFTIPLHCVILILSRFLLCSQSSRVEFYIFVFYRPSSDELVNSVTFLFHLLCSVLFAFFVSWVSFYQIY